jgi:putative SOS response-associated peptidase YedK
VCNRYSISKRELRLRSRFGVIQTEFDPRYNIAPTQRAPIARVIDGVLKLDELQWGFEGFNGQSVMNARCETAQEKRMFRDSWRERHCLVPCDGFYEWKDTPEGKQPYRFVQRSRNLFWFAGLWTDDRFTILTGPAQGCVTAMHDRMPIILRDDATDWWIAPAQNLTSENLVQRCAPANEVECYPVTRSMSNARHITADCIKPIQIAQQELKL